MIPEEIENSEDLPVTLRLLSLPVHCLEIREDEFVEQLQENRKIIKTAEFSLDELKTGCQLTPKIAAVLIKGSRKEVNIGENKIDSFHLITQKMVASYEKQSKNRKTFGNNCVNQPIYEIIRELVPLVNEDKIRV